MVSHRSSNASTAYRTGTTIISTVIHGIVLHDFERDFAWIRLTAGSPVQTAPSGHNAAQYPPGVARARSLGVVPGGWQQCRGAWQRQLLRQRQCATPDGFAAVTLPRCCDDACTASSRGVSLIYQTQDQCPSLASARAVGGGTPLGLGGFHPPLDDSEVRGRISNPPPPLPTPSITASDPHFLSSIIATAGPQVPLLGAQPWPPLRPW